MPTRTKTAPATPRSTRTKVTAPATEAKSPARRSTAANKAGASKPTTTRTANKAAATRAAAKKSGPVPAGTVTAAGRISTGRRGGQPKPRNELGFIIGSPAEAAANAVLEGAPDRGSILAKLRKRKSKTGNGTERNWSPVLTQAVQALQKKGYKIESSFKLVPPAPRASRARKGVVENVIAGEPIADNAGTVTPITDAPKRRRSTKAATAS